MNTRYCSECGHGSQYSAIKPVTCSKCKKPFEKAFASLAPTPPIPVAVAYPSPSRPSPQSPKVGRTFTPARGRQSHYDLNIDQAPKESPRFEGQDRDEYVDRNEVYNEAQRLIASLNPADFVFEADRSTVISSTSIFAPMMAQMQAEEKASGKGKKGKR